MLENGFFFAGISRRSFLKTVTAATAMMGLDFTMTAQVAEAAESDSRPPVIWLHFQECTGCSESLIRASHPDVATLILDMISLDYHETLMAGSGHQAEEALHKTMEEYAGKYILIVEGAVPLKDNGIYCKVAGKTAKDSLEEVAEHAAHIISIGTCASFGGVAAADPNPTQAVPASDVLKDRAVINIPGCPPSPYNLLSTILNLLTFNRLPELDKMNRPMFAYGRKIHEHCERRPHFDAGRFAEKFGDENHSEGYCLYKLGCKGPATFANCMTLKFNDVNVWPISVGHPCIGCTEPDLAFHMSIFDKVQIHNPTPPDHYPDTLDNGEKKGADPVTTAVIGGVAGAALGASAMVAKKLPNNLEDADKRNKELEDEE
ncbi:hydrogenase small subunit [Limisalsivibrio acetivorans]|uniref:hydrogenase small subunit n=1 Tax=Limisalsivibrio acetivorans TaxID=1304888 RepID=UPI0003B710A6|nr:hydrogenase small subunit [Limisalsivibrio acetivorans]